MNDTVNVARSESNNRVLDFIKQVTLAASAGLVIGVGLITNAPTYDWLARSCLIVGFVLFGLSAFAGLVALSFGYHYLRTFLQEAVFEVSVLANDKTFSVWQTVQLWCSFASVIFIGFGLSHVMLSEQPLSTLTMRDAADAVSIASSALPKDETVRKLDRVDLIKGVDPTSGENMTWHVEFDVDLPSKSRRTRDVIVQVKDGKPSVVERDSAE